MTRGYAYHKIEYVSKAYVRIFRKIEYAYDMFRTQTWIHVKCCKVVKRTALFNAATAANNSGNTLPPFLTVLIEILCCSCNVFYSCLRYAKIEYVIVRTYPSKNIIRTLRIVEPCQLLHTTIVDCAQTVYTSAKTSNRSQNWSGIRTQTSRLICIQIGMSAVLLQIHDVTYANIGRWVYENLRSAG